MLVGNDNQANITVANAMGNITIKVNGKEVANEEIDSTVTYVIQAEDIVLGENIIEVDTINSSVNIDVSLYHNVLYGGL